MSTLPPGTSESRRHPTAVRIYRMRIARGACWVIVAALFGVALLAVLDAAFRLPGWLRGCGLAAWLTGTGVIAWRQVVRRLPNEPFEGASHRPREELPSNLYAAGAAATAIAAAMFFATLLPGASGHIRRVALPWSRATSVQYRVVVASGEPIVRRGAPVTLSAYAETMDGSASTAGPATLIGRDRNGTEWKLPMTGNGRGAFHATRPHVADDFEYRVQIGTASSDWFSVTALDPAELTPETVIEVQPPQYAASSKPQIHPGFVSFAGIQHGSAEIRFRFTHPASTAFLEWRPDGGEAVELTTLDLQSARTTFRLNQSGTLTLVAVVERNGKSLRAETPIRIRVTPDEAPRFERVLGVSLRTRAARPGSVVPIEITATDDIGLDSAILEYVLGPDESTRVEIPIALSGTGSPRVEGRIDFNLHGLGRTGDTIRYRVRIADLRRLSDPELKPQETSYPASGWSVLRLDPAAPPLDEQDFLIQRDGIRDALAQVQEAIADARSAAGKLRDETVNRLALAPEHAVRLGDAGDRLTRAISLLHDAARDAELTPDLRPMATLLRELSDQSLRKGEQSFRKAATDNPQERTAAFGSIIESLNHAAILIDRLKSLNHRFAQARLDHKRILQLATEQTALANRDGNTSYEDLANQEREQLARIQAIRTESEPLRAAAQAARLDELRELAGHVASLSAQLRTLDAAIRQIHRGTRLELLAEIAKQQGETIEQAAQLLANIAIGARLAGIEPPRREQFVRIANLIAANRTVDALTELLAIRQGLDAVADTFERWAADRNDPRVGARQIARWQDDLRIRLREATGGKAGAFDELPLARKESLRREQSALQDAMLGLNYPRGGVAISQREAALRHLNAVSNFLAGSGANAEEAMRLSTEALNHLADRLPTLPVRLAQGRGDFVKLQQLQDSILTEVEQIQRGTASINKLSGLVERQRKQAAAFENVDLPGFEVRRLRIHAALTTATAALKSGSLADAAVALQWVKREFERLKLILDGYPAWDEKADELSKRLRGAVNALEAAGPMPRPNQVAVPAAEIEDVARQFSSFPIPEETPSLFFKCRETIQAADAAIRDGKTPPTELLRRARVAANAFAALADRLNGAESELDRVRRLAGNRRAVIAAEDARKRDKKEPDPAAAGEVARQLGRDAEELATTRVGPAGAALKKRLLEQFARLKEQQFPDRMVGLQRSLAEALDELAGLMADIPDLTQVFDRVRPPTLPTEADRYLPSQLHADALRSLARQQMTLHDRITNLPAAVQQLLKPADTNPLEQIERDQRELAEAVSQFAKHLQSEGKAEAAKLALDAATEAARAGNGLANGLIAPAAASVERSGLALRRLGKSAEVLAGRQEELLAQMKAIPKSSDIAAAQHKARGEELARTSEILAQSLEIAGRDDPANETARTTLLEASGAAKTAATSIADAARKVVGGQFDDAEKARLAAYGSLKMCTAKISNLIPRTTEKSSTDPAALNAASSLRIAETAVRLALQQLDAKADRAEVRKAMHMAASALHSAAKVRSELLPEQN